MTDAHPMLSAAARSPVLLVGADFDGTLSSLVDEPGGAVPLPGAIEALGALAALPHTHVAVVSGRGLADLRARLGRVPRHVWIVGSHGAEGDDGADTVLSATGKELLDRIATELEGVAATIPGTLVERKPVAIALHYRRAGDAGARRAVEAVERLAASEPSLHLRRGSMVAELVVTHSDKGVAIRRLAHRAGATATVFFGDDLTDEDAFAALHQGDVGVKVGAGESVAPVRVESPAEVVSQLSALAEARARYLESRRPTPIERHSVLSDQRTVAVVSPDARLVWLCLPRIDSGAMFADLLDSGGGCEHGAGSFDIGPADGTPPRGQEYLGDSFVLRTSWDGFHVTDYFDVSGGRAWQRPGRSDLIRVIEGRGRVSVRFAPRLDFGRMGTRLLAREGGLEVEGSPDPVVLFAPGVDWRLVEAGPHHTAEAQFDLGDKPLVFELRYGTASLRPPVLVEQERRTSSLRAWAGWAGALSLPCLHADLVRRSALVLKALCHGPTGAIAAAATTSLPEQLGGVRNWDYRYCWPRDAALAAAALVRLGNTGHALKFLDWVLGVVDKCESPDRLRPIYTVGGGHLGPEGDISNLSGYGQSRPVRVGNAAANQVQLDVFAPIVDLVAMLAERGAPISPEHWRLVRAMVQGVEARWHEPDHGIWEIRGPRRHHLHSRVMCWHAVHRALLVEETATGRHNAEWQRLADTIAADVLEHGWNEQLGAFSIAYGEPHLDAAALWVGLSGLVPPDDPRFVSTVDRVVADLLDGPVVYRYRCDDGLPGREGGFLLCTAWLIESLVLIGRRDRARELLERYAALAGPTGLFTEEFDPRYGLALGNIAQAYSHLGFINAAMAVCPG